MQSITLSVYVLHRVLIIERDLLKRLHLQYINQFAALRFAGICFIMKGHKYYFCLFTKLPNHRARISTLPFNALLHTYSDD